VPRKPIWYSTINEIVLQLEAYPRPFIDRPAVELLFGVGRRRAQQILAPWIHDYIGSNGLADRDALIAYLRGLATGDDVHYERRRRRKLAEVLERLRKERLDRPKLLVEAPLAVVNQDFANLPPGVRLEPGRLSIEFQHPRQALEKLLALAMAIGKDFDSFERATRRDLG